MKVDNRDVSKVVGFIIKYLGTLNTDIPRDIYGSDKFLAETELTKFIEWLGECTEYYQALENRLKTLENEKSEISDDMKSISSLEIIASKINREEMDRIKL